MKYIFPVTAIVFLSVFLGCTGYFFFARANSKELKTKVWKERIKQYKLSHQVSETSIYIFSDKDIYIAGENLWYNAFILDPKTVELSELDHILYLQLVNTTTDSTVWKEMYPILHGTSAGHVYLSPTLPAGKYILRAYSAHSFFRDQKNLYAVAPIQIVKAPSSIKHFGQPAIEAPFNKGKKLTINITGLRPTYNTKELVTLKLMTTDETGKPLPAVISLKVYDRLFHNPAIDHDILRYYYEKKDNPTEKQRILPDSIAGHITSKKSTQQSLMLFNYNKSITHFLSTDQQGKFHLDADNLAIGQRFFIKYFSEKELNIHISDPFDTILNIHPSDQYREKSIAKEEENLTTNKLQYNNLLKEIVIKSKGREFSDPYLGFLDSIAKFEDNFDYVGQCGWLNCPACGSGTKPIEGVTYSALKPDKRLSVTSHPFSFGGDDYINQPYHYPKYTEEELLKKFKMVVAKGFYQHAPFYSPDYSKEDKQRSDTRNVLYWNPLILTDQNGETTIQFYTSDITATFIGIAEGVSLKGHVGTGVTDFLVR